MPPPCVVLSDDDKTYIRENYYIGGKTIQDFANHTHHRTTAILKFINSEGLTRKMKPIAGANEDFCPDDLIKQLIKDGVPYARLKRTYGLSVRYHKKLKAEALAVIE